MSGCPDPSVLDAVALGAAAGDAREQVWAHVETCSGCATLLDELMRLYGSDPHARLSRGPSRDASADPSESIDRSQGSWALASTLASDPPPPHGDARIGAIEAGRVIGRYRVLDKLGEGAMGEVFAAHDPELDRRVALKVLHADPLVLPEARKQRLVREAQAMAKLAHPNVVTVFDVGVDASSGQLFVAMELVPGTTLGAWLKASRRSVREVIDAFVQAGTGLAAAHTAGLVHRDFKPDNVLVGRDGRVRVSDFGLARASIGEARVSTDLEARPADLTQAGAIVGTPAYMAPEQLRGAATDARTDQFAFGIALHEALSGVRPFEGRTFGELRDSVVSGRHRSFGPLRPRWIRAVVSRALATEPSARFSSMNALVAELERDRHRNRQRALWLLGSLAVVALLATTTFFVASRRGYVISKSSPSCRDAPRRVDAAYVAPAVGDTDASRARKAQLDAYADGLRASFVDACETSALPPTPRDERRAECLDGRLRALAASAKHASDGGALVLPSIAICSDDRVLASDVEAPPSEEARTEAASLRSDLAEADEELRSFDLRAASERVTGDLVRARKLSYDPVTAEVLLRTAKLREKAFRFQEAKEALQEAVDLARSSKHDAVLLDATLELARVVGVDLGRSAEAETWIGFARAESKRRPADRESAARLALVVGAVARRAGKLDEARAAFESALAIQEHLSGKDSGAVAEALRLLSEVHLLLGDNALAVRDARRANEIVRADVLLSSGREAALYALTLGDALLAVGEPKEALVSLARVRQLAIFVDLGSSNVVLEAADVETRASIATGDLATAHEHATEALAGLLSEEGETLVFVDPRGASRTSTAIDFAARIRSKVNRPDDALSVSEQNAFAAMRAVEGDEPAALIALGHALANVEQNPQTEASARGAIFYNRALLALRAGDLALASTSIESASSAFEIEVGPHHLRSAMANLLRARILARLGSPLAKDVARDALRDLVVRLVDDDSRVRLARALSETPSRPAPSAKGTGLRAP